MKYRTIFAFLSLFSLAVGARIALVQLYWTSNELDSLSLLLVHEGHQVFWSDTFIDISNQDVLWLVPSDPPITESNMRDMMPFVERGGHLILALGCRTFINEPANQILQQPEWYEELGRPIVNDDAVWDEVPDTFFVEPSPMPTSFIVNFIDDWMPAHDMDTILHTQGTTLSLESTGALQIAGWGGRGTYSSFYDSFAVSILAGDWNRGKITTIGNGSIFCNYPFFGNFCFLHYYDNRQFARQLFATNERVDTAWLEATDTGIVAHLEGSYTPFVADSSKWRFEYPSSFPDSFYGYELSAAGCAEGVFALYPPHPIHDSVEVCLKILPDATGETVLRRGPLCGTFWIEWDDIVECRNTPGSIAISVSPNPFNVACRIEVTGLVVSDMIQILDLSGRRIRELQLNGGVAIWDGNSVPGKSCPAGIYLVVIARNGATKPILLLR